MARGWVCLHLRSPSELGEGFSDCHAFGHCLLDVLIGSNKLGHQGEGVVQKISGYDHGAFDGVAEDDVALQVCEMVLCMWSICLTGSTWTPSTATGRLRPYTSRSPPLPTIDFASAKIWSGRQCQTSDCKICP